jgi:hypothetical protein
MMFLYLLDKLSLGSSSRQSRDNVNVISSTANVREFGTQVAANSSQISMQARPHF